MLVTSASKYCLPSPEPLDEFRHHPRSITPWFAERRAEQPLRSFEAAVSYKILPFTSSSTNSNPPSDLPGPVSMLPARNPTPPAQSTPTDPSWTPPIQTTSRSYDQADFEVYEHAPSPAFQRHNPPQRTLQRMTLPDERFDGRQNFKYLPFSDPKMPSRATPLDPGTLPDFVYRPTPAVIAEAARWDFAPGPPKDGEISPSEESRQSPSQGRTRTKSVRAC